MKRNDLLRNLNDYLGFQNIKDYCPNGLQVAGKEEINKIVAGVTANQAFIDAAIGAKADAILVHHGFFFKGEPAEIVGIKKNRIAALLKHDINLFAYHLPLDLHPEVGNNVLFGNAMEWFEHQSFSMLGIEGLGRITTLNQECIAEDLAADLAKVLQRKPQVISPDIAKPIKKVAWCTGAAQDGITAAYLQGADAYISGEVSERTFSEAKEYGLHYFVCGHHATERFGVRALGEYLAKQFSLECEFVDINNPI